MNCPSDPRIGSVKFIKNIILESEHQDIFSLLRARSEISQRSHMIIEKIYNLYIVKTLDCQIHTFYNVRGVTEKKIEKRRQTLKETDDKDW